MMRITFRFGGTHPLNDPVVEIPVSMKDVWTPPRWENGRIAFQCKGTTPPYKFCILGPGQRGVVRFEYSNGSTLDCYCFVKSIKPLSATKQEVVFEYEGEWTATHENIWPKWVQPKKLEPEEEISVNSFKEMLGSAGTDGAVSFDQEGGWKKR